MHSRTLQNFRQNFSILTKKSAPPKDGADRKYGFSGSSVRGSFGWPDISFSDENLLALANFYLGNFAHALKIYQKRHAVTMAEVAERFMNGFEYRTHALAWQLSVMREEFEGFRPSLPSVYDFEKKWAFVMWSLERQERRMPILRRLFMEKVALVEGEASAGGEGVAKS